MASAKAHVKPDPGVLQHRECRNGIVQRLSNYCPCPLIVWSGTDLRTCGRRLAEFAFAGCSIDHEVDTSCTDGRRVARESTSRYLLLTAGVFLFLLFSFLQVINRNDFSTLLIHLNSKPAFTVMSSGFRRSRTTS